MATTTDTTVFAPPRGTRRRAAAALILAAGLLAPAPASADAIQDGFALFQTKVGITNGVFSPSFVDLASFLGMNEPVVPLRGLPPGSFDFGPARGVLPTGTSDTILKVAGIEPSPFLPGPVFPVGSTATVDVELVALSLTSVDPVGLYTTNGTAFFDVFITLNPNIQSLGRMNINHEFDDGGTYDGVLSLRAIKEFVPVDRNGLINGFQDIYVIDVDVAFNGSWSHSPPPFYPTIPNIDFFPQNGALWAAVAATCPGPALPAGTTCYQTAVSPARVPEPATLALFAFGLAGLGFMRRRQKFNA